MFGVKFEAVRDLVSIFLSYFGKGDVEADGLDTRSNTSASSQQSFISLFLSLSNPKRRHSTTAILHILLLCNPTLLTFPHTS
jgi:hypothetical protein